MLEEALARHRARLRFTLALRGLERGLLIAAPLALLVALLVWRRLCPESLGGQELTLFLFSVFGLAGLVVGWCTPLSRPPLPRPWSSSPPPRLLLVSTPRRSC